ncbi:MAG: hypothetical protein JWN70_5449 [Planctomycetaceae bacterium]|nr:hypothetical protein [Planctomycetaceae bacterium]
MLYGRFVLLAALIWSVPVTSYAADPLREALAPIAKRLIADLKSKNQTAVTVGDFTGPAKLDTNFGPGITNILSQALNALQPGIVKKDAPYSVRGRYDTVIVDEEGKPLAADQSPGENSAVRVRVTAELTDDNGNLIDSGKANAVVQENKTEVADNSAIARLLGLTLSLPALGPEAARNGVVTATLAKQANGEDVGFIDGTKARPKEGRPYGVEVLVADKAAAPQSVDEWEKISARPLKFEDHRLFVDLKEDEVYALRIYNESPEDAAVYIEIDGINVFSFTNREFRNELGQPKYSYYVIEKGEPYSRTIAGWHRSNQQADSFLITEYGKGASNQPLPDSIRGKTGTIEVSFALAWDPTKATPTEAIAARAAGKIETGFGPPLAARQKEVHRKIGMINDLIVIRYTH